MQTNTEKKHVECPKNRNLTTKTKQKNRIKTKIDKYLNVSKNAYKINNRTINRYS